MDLPVHLEPGGFRLFYFIYDSQKRKKETVEMFFKSGKDTPVFKICCPACCPASFIKGYSSAVAVHSPFSAFSRFHQLKMADSLIGTGLFYWLQQEWHWNQDFSAVSYAQWEQYFP